MRPLVQPEPVRQDATVSSWVVFRRLLRVARPLRGRLLLAVLLGFLTVGSSVALMGTAAYLIAKASLQPALAELSAAIVGVRAFGISRGVFRYLERLVSHGLTFQALADLRVWVYARLEPLAPAGLERHHSGDLLSRLMADVDALQMLFGRVLTPPLVALLVGITCVAFASALLPAAGAALGLALLVAALAVPWLAAAQGRVTGRRLAGARGRLATEIVEMLQGAPDLVAYGRAAEWLARAAAVDAELTHLARSTAVRAGLGDALAALLAGLGAWLVLVVAIPAVGAGQLDGPYLGVLVLAALASFEAVQPLPAALQHLEASLQAARRLFTVADTPPPVRDPSHPAAILGVDSVTLEAARLRYGPGQPWALDGVDLRLEAGRRVALIGASGAGKTSLANVLLRFRELDGGRGMLNGVDLRAYAQDDVRRVIGLVAQDAHLFNASILDNVRLGRPDANEVAVQAALLQARLWEWVESLPNGWHTPVGEGGAQVSGGQRQRIALARALLADFPLLILDEPTASLDPDTADTLIDDLVAATAGRAVLLITHHLNALAQVDEVVVLDRGRVVQRGRPTDLRARDGPYRRLQLAAQPDTRT